MSIRRQFRKFNRTIYLTKQSDEYKEARKKEHSILKDIAKKYRENGYPIIKIFRQGSFATDTAIKKLDGDFDVDRAIVIKESQAPDNPVDCKKDILEVLENRGFINSKIKTPCVTADYVSLDLHIDYAVYQVDDSDTYSIALGKKQSSLENKKWEYSELKEFIDWINGSENYIGLPDLTTEEKLQFKRLVRYMKRWRDYKIPNSHKEYIYSIGLTIMLKESFHPVIDANSVEDDLQSLIQTIEYILNYKSYFTSWEEDRYNVTVIIPFAPRVDIFRKHGQSHGTVFRNSLKRLLDNLIKASHEQSLKKQCIILQSVFGDDFEIADDPKPSNGSHNFKKVVSPSAGIVIPSQGA